VARSGRWGTHWPRPVRQTGIDLDEGVVQTVITFYRQWLFLVDQLIAFRNRMRRLHPFPHDAEAFDLLPLAAASPRVAAFSYLSRMNLSRAVATKYAASGAPPPTRSCRASSTRSPRWRQTTVDGAR
jgi:hypothetical protein